MTREDAKAVLVSLGINEPTNEQVTNYLNRLEQETNGLKTQLSNAQKEAQNVADLKKQLKDLQDSKLTDEEKATREQQEREQRIADLEAKLKATELKSQLASQGITGEDADKLISSMSDGSFDVALLGQIISAKEEAAAKKKEEEIAKSSTNPGGDNGAGKGKDDESKPDDVANAEAMASFFGHKETDDKTKNYYVL